MLLKQEAKRKRAHSKYSKDFSVTDRNDERMSLYTMLTSD